jgi:hypothetical protein
VIVHHSIDNDSLKLKNLSENLDKMSKTAEKSLTKLRIEKTKSANVNKIEKVFKENDIVFVLDRYSLPGNSRPLKTKFFASPCVVIKPYYTTALVQRIADGFKSLYSNNDLKLFKGGNSLFKSLPTEIQKILLHDFQDLLEPDFQTITKLDPLDIPNAISLTDSIENISFSSPYFREGHTASPSAEISEDLTEISDINSEKEKQNNDTLAEARTETQTESQNENDSESENEDEDNTAPEPEPEFESDSETLVNEEINEKQLRSGKLY